MKRTWRECGRILRNAWEDDPKEFVGEIVCAIAIMGFPAFGMMMLMLLGGK